VETPIISLYKYIAGLQQSVADLEEEDEEYMSIPNEKFYYLKDTEKKYKKLMKELQRPV